MYTYVVPKCKWQIENFDVTYCTSVSDFIYVEHFAISIVGRVVKEIPIVNLYTKRGCSSIFDSKLNGLVYYYLYLLV